MSSLGSGLPDVDGAVLTSEFAEDLAASSHLPDGRGHQGRKPMTNRG
jgi:hypothetical protein